MIRMAHDIFLPETKDKMSPLPFQIEEPTKMPIESYFGTVSPTPQKNRFFPVLVHRPLTALSTPCPFSTFYRDSCLIQLWITYMQRVRLVLRDQLYNTHTQGSPS